jgi:hypothetical protein
VIGDDQEQPSPPVSEHAPPPQRGWYRDPANPNYERFWDGQKWVNRRYWGGDVPNMPAEGPLGAPPARRPGPPSFNAPVQYRGFFGAPLNPRSPARQIVVAGIGIVLIIVYLGLHIFPGRVVVVLAALGLVGTLLMLPARLRFLRDPARQAAIREPIVFEARVWLRFNYAPTYWGYPLFNRWDLAVRSDSFQVTNWIWGQRDRARSTFFHAASAVMWRDLVEGRDCIVLSGPTYRRSKVEFAFAAIDGSNPQAWAALSAAGVRALEASQAAPPPSAAPPLSPVVPSTSDTGASRRFRRLGHDLGSGRAVTPTPPPPPPGSGSADAASGPRNGRGPGGLRAPIPARRIAPVAVVVIVAFFLLMPLVLVSLVRLTHPATTAPPAVDQVSTTQCILNPARDEVEWSGELGADPPVPESQVVVFVRTESGALVGQATTQIQLSDAANQPSPAGPLSITVTGAPTAVTCSATATG